MQNPPKSSEEESPEDDLYDDDDSDSEISDETDDDDEFETEEQPILPKKVQVEYEDFVSFVFENRDGELHKIDYV